MTEKMTKNAYYAEIDHALKSVYLVYLVYLVSEVLDQIDETTKWTKWTERLRRTMSKSARCRGWWKAGCAREKATGVDLQRKQPMAYPLHLSRSCAHICNELEKPITRGGR